MSFLLTIILFILSNTGIYFYSILSKQSNLIGWKIILIPLYFFPILYFSNMLFAGAWLASNKANLSTSVAGVTNLALGVIIFMIGHLVYYKQSISINMIIGSSFVVIGAIIINLR